MAAQSTQKKMTRRAMLGIQAIPENRDILICIFQRGAADGLNSLVPHGDPDYAEQRGGLAVPAPGELNGALDLDGFFGLHPALAPLQDIYTADGNMALVHACGVPHGSRSHFDAQVLVERGVSSKSSSADGGWLGRYLALQSPLSDSAFRAVAFSGNVPVSLTGAQEPLAVSNLSEFSFDSEVVDTGYTRILSGLFREGLPFSSPALAALGAIDELQEARLEEIAPDNGAVYPDSPLAGKLAQAAKLIKSSLPVEIICMDSDGWDHHENLALYLDLSLSELAGAISAFYKDMGERMNSITLLVHTEFGRRVMVNNSAGVDHGTGALAFVIGGGVLGGQVYSDWPGLADENLDAGEDLAITTDLREVLWQLLQARLGAEDLAAIFPGFSPELTQTFFTSR